MSIQTLRELSQNKRLLIVMIPIIISIIFTYLLPAMEEPESSHEFADQRRIITWLPHSLHIISNIPFLIVGMMGISELKKMRMTSWERTTWIICFLSMIATFFCSTFYHLYPNSYTLIWDRLPVIFTFAPIIAITIYEGVNKEMGKNMLVPLLLISAGCTFHWFLSNDIRYYSLCQMLSLYLMIIFPVLFPYKGVVEKPKMNEKIVLTEGRIQYYGSVVLLFILAKICESLDSVIYTLDFHFISGHTLKHLFTAFAGLLLVSMLRRRRLNDL